MKGLVVIVGLLVCTQYCFATPCESGGELYQAYICNENSLCVSHRNKETILESDLIDPAEISCSDIDFDGEPDIILTFPPTGKIQYSTIFLFDKTLSEYKKNEKLSNLPCLEVNHGNKTISGTCFSSSACDHWAEHYKLENSMLKLFMTEGKYCNPVTGEAYKYSEKYEGGKLSERHVEEISSK